MRRDRVKLGVAAPNYVKVMRQELLGGEDARRLQREAGPDAAARVNPAGNDRR
jgi:sRNA-binding carbon storage regulator CsrA